jgi:hypothetical protein
MAPSLIVVRALRHRESARRNPRASYASRSSTGKILAHNDAVFGSRSAPTTYAGPAGLTRAGWMRCEREQYVSRPLPACPASPSIRSARQGRSWSFVAEGDCQARRGQALRAPLARPMLTHEGLRRREGSRVEGRGSTASPVPFSLRTAGLPKFKESFMPLRGTRNDENGGLPRAAKRVSWR